MNFLPQARAQGEVAVFLSRHCHSKRRKFLHQPTHPHNCDHPRQIKTGGQHRCLRVHSRSSAQQEANRFEISLDVSKGQLRAFFSSCNAWRWEGTTTSIPCSSIFLSSSVSAYPASATATSQGLLRVWLALSIC